MKKINSAINKSIFVGYVLKILFLTVLTVVAFSAMFSFFVMKLDLDGNYLSGISVAVAALSSVITSYFSVKGFKNNGCALGMISALPLILFSTINIIVSKEAILMYIIKLVLCLAVSALFGSLSVKNSKKIRVKK